MSENTNTDDKIPVAPKEYDKFIMVWNTSNSTAEVMRRMDQPSSEAQRRHNTSKAAYLRKKGYYMKSMRGGPQSVDHAKLGGYSVWVNHQVEAGNTDGRALKMSSFENSLQYKEYMGYANYRREAIADDEEPLDFDDWLVETGYSSRPSIESE